MSTVNYLFVTYSANVCEVPDVFENLPYPNHILITGSRYPNTGDWRPEFWATLSGRQVGKKISVKNAAI